MDLKPHGASCDIEKIECKNHLLRNYGKKTKGDPQQNASWVFLAHKRDLRWKYPKLPKSYNESHTASEK